MFSLRTVLHVRKAALYLFQQLWKTFTIGNCFYYDDPSITKSYINVVFHARALPTGERMNVFPVAVLHPQAFSTLFDEISRSFLVI